MIVLGHRGIPSGLDGLDERLDRVDDHQLRGRLEGDRVDGGCGDRGLGGVLECGNPRGDRGLDVRDVDRAEVDPECRTDGLDHRLLLGVLAGQRVVRAGKRAVFDAESSPAVRVIGVAPVQELFLEPLDPSPQLLVDLLNFRHADSGGLDDPLHPREELRTRSGEPEFAHGGVEQTGFGVGQRISVDPREDQPATAHGRGGIDGRADAELLHPVDQVPEGTRLDDRVDGGIGGIRRDTCDDLLRLPLDSLLRRIGDGNCFGDEFCC